MKLSTLEGKTAIVTGGAQGLGRGIVDCLARDGANIAVVDIQGDKATEVAEELRTQGRKALGVRADLTRNDQVERAVKEVLDFFGRVDILVNNAGGYPDMAGFAVRGTRIADRGEDEWDGCYSVNLKTTVLMCRAVIPHLVAQKSGKIVNISSASATSPSGTLVCYATMKAGIVHYSRMLSRDLAADNINVNCVLPGIIYTPLWERGAAELSRVVPGAENWTPREFFEKTLIPGVPLGREQTAEDIGNAVAFFVSEEAKNITGQSLNVDGGMSFV